MRECLDCWSQGNQTYLWGRLIQTPVRNSRMFACGAASKQLKFILKTCHLTFTDDVVKVSNQMQKNVQYKRHVTTKMFRNQLYFYASKRFFKERKKVSLSEKTLPGQHEPSKICPSLCLTKCPPSLASQYSDQSGSTLMWGSLMTTNCKTETTCTVNTFITCSKYTDQLWTHLSLLLLQVALEVGWFWEKRRVPSEVTLPIRVLNVQPDDVIWNIVAIKSSIHSLHVGFVIVVPATLMVAECKQRGQGLVPWQRMRGEV